MRAAQAIDLPLFRTLAAVSLAGIAAVAVYSLIEGRLVDAAALGALAALGTAFLLVRDRLPSLFDLLFVAAGLANTAGYVFNLWHEGTPFDETVHAFTSFTICAAIGWILLGRSRLGFEGGAKLVIAVTAIGLVVGLAWEGFEWLIGIVGGWHDTLVDLAMDGIGALLGGLLCAWASKSRNEEKGEKDHEFQPTA